jgi:hypothetical protein
LTLVQAARAARLKVTSSSRMAWRNDSAFNAAELRQADVAVGGHIMTRVPRLPLPTRGRP